MYFYAWLPHCGWHTALYTVSAGPILAGWMGLIEAVIPSSISQDLRCSGADSTPADVGNQVTFQPPAQSVIPLINVTVEHPE